MPRIVGIGGSLREGSYSPGALLVPVTNAQQAFAAGMLVHPQSRDRLHSMAHELVRLASLELAQWPASAWA